MKKKTSNKSKSRIMLVLILATVLIVGCIGGLTVAKYVTTGSGSDSARAARFGVTLSGGGDAFAKEYSNGSAVTVSSTAKMIAPGTSGTFSSVEMSGTPEVRVKVTNNAEVTLTGWEVSGSYYCPLKITVGNAVYNGMNYPTAAAFEAAIEEAINGFSAEYAPGTDLSTKEATGSITWEWAFSGGVNQTDEKDTALAALAAAPTITIESEVTVTQID